MLQSAKDVSVKVKKILLNRKNIEIRLKKETFPNETRFSHMISLLINCLIVVIGQS